jgi:hypothetical protein
MARDENSKVTFYADADVKQKLDELDPGTKSHTINALLRKGFEGGSTTPERLDVMDARVRTLEAAYRRTPMYNSELHSYCSEFYTVEKTLEVVVSRNGESITVRLEALRNEETGRYSTRAFMDENVTLQPTYPQSHGKYEREAEDFRIWVPFPDFPWTDRDSADAVLMQALGFLRERCDSPSRL